MQPLAHHLVLRVQNLPQATTFWGQVFGVAPRYQEDGQYSLFEVWGWELLLMVGMATPMQFGLRVETLAELDPWARQWRQQELVVERKQFFHPALQATETALNIHDPDGNRFSVYTLTPYTSP